MIASCAYNPQFGFVCEFVDLTNLAWCGALFTVALIACYFIYKLLSGGWK